MADNDLEKVEYLVCCISLFGETHNLSQSEAYRYLKKYRGFDFLYDCYDAEHTLSLDNAIEDLTNLCHRNGGELVL